MSRTLSNLVWPDGRINSSGILNKVYCIRKSDIKTFPVVKDAPTTVTEAVTYEGDFELHPGKTGISIYSTQGVGKAEFESSGEKDCKVIVNKLTASYPDMDDEGVDFANANINTNSIFIVPYFVAGGKVVYVVIGGRYSDPEVTIKGTTGDKPGSTKGMTIEVSASDCYALPRYTGLIPLPDGTLNCQTGVFTATADTPDPKPPVE